MATRSTVPNEVERGDTLIESREPMIISLVLELTCDFDLCSFVPLSTAFMHLPTKFGEAIFIRIENISVFL